ncbi:MAG: hypothetical protein ACRDY0_08780 [Acidimicrobiales bacterium]
MATIRANCETCGDVELTPVEVQVQVCSSTEEIFYSFVCPGCAQPVTREAAPRVADLLVAAGVRRIVWSWPAELAEERHGPPISYDELLGFHFDMQHDDWIAQCLTSMGA